MNDAVHVIEHVLKVGILSPGLTVVPERGATAAEVADEERLLLRPLTTSLKRVLLKWNGLDLDLVRLYGCGAVMKGIDRLSARQIALDREEALHFEAPMVIGSDPSGFLYVEDVGGPLWSLDTDGGEVTRLADDLDDFVCRVVFGEDAQDFAGLDWKQTLREAGLIT